MNSKGIVGMVYINHSDYPFLVNNFLEFVITEITREKENLAIDQSPQVYSSKLINVLQI